MASSDDHVKVDVYYNGTFVPKPLLYFDPDITTISDVDLRELDFEAFMELLSKVTRMSCVDVYFCLPDESLGEGIHSLYNDGDYREFLEMGYNNGKRMKVYVDQYNEPIFDWIEADDGEEEGSEDLDCEEDEDSVFSDPESVDHEEDGELDANNHTTTDQFLNILCPSAPLNEDKHDDLPQYPIHNEKQAWDKMEPILGMRFSNPSELKHMLSNYAVAHGYDL